MAKECNPGFRGTPYIEIRKSCSWQAFLYNWLVSRMSMSIYFIHAVSIKTTDALN